MAAGLGSGGLQYDIVPGQPDQSILAYRIASTHPGVMMPELGKRLVHDEGVALVRQWIASMALARSESIDQCLRLASSWCSSKASTRTARPAFSLPDGTSADLLLATSVRAGKTAVFWPCTRTAAADLLFEPGSAVRIDRGVPPIRSSTGFDNENGLRVVSVTVSLAAL